MHLDWGLFGCGLRRNIKWVFYLLKFSWWFWGRSSEGKSSRSRKSCFLLCCLRLERVEEIIRVKVYVEFLCIKWLNFSWGCLLTKTEQGYSSILCSSTLIAFIAVERHEFWLCCCLKDSARRFVLFKSRWHLERPEYVFFVCRGCECQAAHLLGYPLSLSFSLWNWPYDSCDPSRSCRNCLGYRDSTSS